jgi:hypothetical protein
MLEVRRADPGMRKGAAPAECRGGADVAPVAITSGAITSGAVTSGAVM